MKSEREGTHNANTIDTIEPASRLRFLLDQIVESFTAAFLHALKTAPQVHWEFFFILEMVLQDIEPAKNRAFVVR